MKRFITLLIIICAGINILLTGCYTDTITKLENVSIQFPLFVGYDRFTRIVPDTTIQFNNLLEFTEYSENRSKLDQAEILDFNYRIDSLKYVDTSGKEFIFDPVRNDAVYDSTKKTWSYYSSAPIKFDFMRFYIHFTEGTNPNLWVLDPDTANSKYLLGQFVDTPADPLTVNFLYRQAKNIVPFGVGVQKIISNAIKSRPQFYIVSEFSDAKLWNSRTGQWEPLHRFPYELIKFDLIIRLHVKL